VGLRTILFKGRRDVNVNVNVRNIYRRRRMSRVRIGGAGGRGNVRPCRMQLRSVQIQMCLVSMVMVAELFL